MIEVVDNEIQLGSWGLNNQPADTSNNIGRISEVAYGRLLTTHIFGGKVLKTIFERAEGRQVFASIIYMDGTTGITSFSSESLKLTKTIKMAQLTYQIIDEEI